MTASTLLYATGWAVAAAAILLLLADEALYHVQSTMNRTIRLDEWILRYRRRMAVACLALATYLVSSGVARSQEVPLRLAQRSRFVDRSAEIMRHLDRQQALMQQILAQARPGALPVGTEVVAQRI